MVVIIGFLVVANKAGWLKEKKEAELWFGQNIGQVCSNWGCLVKDGDRWMVKSEEREEPANDELVTSSIAKLEEVRLETLVSENKDRFLTMGIEPEEPVWLVANGKKLIIGDIANDYSGSYVKPDSEDKIYKIETVIDKNSWSQADGWRLKHVSNWPIYQIKTMAVDYGGKQLVVNKDEPKWSELKTVIDKLAFLEVEKLWPDMIPDDKDMTYNFRLTMENDEVKTLIIGKRKISYREIKYWASQDGVYYYEIEANDGLVLTDKFN